MNLTDLIKADNSNLEAEVPYSTSEMGEIIFRLRYIDKETFSNLDDKCKTVTFDQKTHQPLQTRDEDKLLRSLIKNCVTGWKGLTYRKLRYLINLDKEVLRKLFKENPQLNLDSEIAYNAEFCFQIFKLSYGINTWFMQSIMNISLFQDDLSDLETELKNSKLSQSGS